MNLFGLAEKNPSQITYASQIEKHPNFRNVNRHTENQAFEENSRLPYLVRRSSKGPNFFTVTINPAKQAIKQDSWVIKKNNHEFEFCSTGLKKANLEQLLFNFHELRLIKVIQKMESYIEALREHHFYFSRYFEKNKIRWVNLNELIEKNIDEARPGKFEHKHALIIDYLVTFGSNQEVVFQYISKCGQLKVDHCKQRQTLLNAYIQKYEEIIIHKMHKINLILNKCLLDDRNLDSILGKIKRQTLNLIESTHNIQNKWPKKINYTLNFALFEKAQACIAACQTAIQQLQQVFDPICYHGLCSNQRATRLLKNKPDGSFLIRTSQVGQFRLSYMRGKKIYHAKIRIYLNGTLSEHNKQTQLAIQDQVYSLTQTRFRPLENAPLEHTIAQFEWNLANSSLSRMLGKARPGSCFLTKVCTGSYELYVVEDELFTVHAIKVKNKRIYCQAGNSQLVASSLYQLITEQLGLKYNLAYGNSQIKIMEELYYRELLPKLQKQGLPWGKASRQQYPFLSRSIWYDQAGNIYEQSHGRPFNTNQGLFVPAENKLLLGKGGYKSVWQLKPFYPLQSCMPMVRAKFFKEPPGSFNSHRLHIAKLKKEFPDKAFLFPEFLFYRNFGNQEVYAQIMPHMLGGNLEEAIQKNQLSLLGKLRAMHDISAKLAKMHANGWVHRDIKPGNIILASNDTDEPQARLSDFDFAIPLSCQIKLQYENFSPLFADPVVFKDDLLKMFEARLHDQFSFGATLYFVLTGQLLRGSATSLSDLFGWVTENDFCSPNFPQLDPMLKNIIRGCCLGAPAERPYRLQEFSIMLWELALENELMQDKLLGFA